ncbi:calcium-activated chloride channel regulator 1-like [Pseudophryne corroboree]|uniref:calcium-activated chloride channel regulator 1-like n=1 Tax=Pseudophryne corroboree TaxID=495146 RepID=UPI003081CEEB
MTNSEAYSRADLPVPVNVSAHSTRKDLHCNALTASHVQLRNHGYENILIAVHPQVPENPEIITIIQDMITEASLYLFNATKRRFFYREVKIILPSTWQSFDLQRPSYEKHAKANVIISNPNLNYGNDPYTLHYRGCGKRGEYIHFTPDFLTDDRLLPVYGPHGRVFVHEWAHFRWGVFDEYNYDTLSSTQCSSELAGMYICKSRSCSDGDCIVDPQTGNLEEGCMFLVNSTQKMKTSIMYMQALSSVVEFCYDHDHDKEAPNMQNKMCSYRSTWDVIKGSDDFKSTLPMSGMELPPPPSFTLLQSRARVVCLVLDVSDNMITGNRIRWLRQAAAIFIQHIIEGSSHVGIVTFNETTEVKSPLRHIVNDDVRWNLTSFLPNTASGGLSICKGVLSGLQVIKELDGHTEGSEIILAVSGSDRNIYKCLSEVTGSGTVIHTIAMGSNADPELEQLAEFTGGTTFFASDSMESDNLIGAFTQITPIHGITVDPFIKITSVLKLIQVSCHLSGSVFIDSTVGNDTSFIITWQAPEPPNIIIQDPTGYNYTNKEFEHDHVSHVSHLKVPGTAQGGTWTYKITNSIHKLQALGILVASRSSSKTIPALVVTADKFNHTVHSPHPVILFAELKQGFTVILGAHVTAVIESEDEDPIIVTLNDNGAGADITKDDGIYSIYVFWFRRDGRHTVKILAEWTNDVSLMPMQSSRAMYVPGYIENDAINMNPPKPLISGEAQFLNETFSRILFLGSFIVSNVSQYAMLEDVFPPCKIVDLEARMENDYVLLSWTAPGDNYDQGAASSYDIRMSNSPIDLRQHFSSSIFINASILKPKNAGDREIFSFKFGNTTAHMSVIIYIAIRSTDKASHQSEISNLVHVTRPRVQEKEINYAYSKVVVKYSTTTIVITIVSVISLCLTLGYGVYSWKKQNSFRLDSNVSDIDSRTQHRSIKDAHNCIECQDEEFPLQVVSGDDLSAETILVLDEKTIV